jgi:TonB family protein
VPDSTLGAAAASKSPLNSPSFTSKAGAPSGITVTKSTGFANLDQASILAIQQAHFIPAHKNGAAVAASADIDIIWRAPAK